jgi:DNA repair exonuclease SbcCD ATPase subunit
MKILKIKIENFKSLYDPVEIDFQSVKGFWKISGAVGAGKTTIGEAIIYGLFGTVGGKNNGDLISWGRKHGLVELWCQSKGKKIYIKRELNAYGQSPVYVEVDGEELLFTNKRNAQSQLEQEYYDTSKAVLELLCIISFNNFKSLATLNTNDTKKFLDQMLGFYILTEYSDICKQLKSNNMLEITKLSYTIGQLKSQITKLEQLSNIEVINANKDEIGSQIKELNDIYKTKVTTYKEKVNELTLMKDKYEQEKSGIMALGSKLKKEIEFIQKGICPTCGAPIDQSTLEDKQNERKLLLSQYENLITSINDVCAKINKVNFDKENETKELLSKIDECKHILVRLEEQEKHKIINESEIVNINNDIKEYNDKLCDLQKEDCEWGELLAILSSTVRGEILKSFIPSLNKNIEIYSQYLKLPYIIEFDHNFKCGITLYNDSKQIPISSLSTGQLKITDMVIILGVLGTIINPNKFNIMFLDELFSNLDSDLRNELCGVLRKFLKDDNTIFIISHTDLDDRYFDGEISMKLELKNKYEKHSRMLINKI